jgi:hypothetical protein
MGLWDVEALTISRQSAHRCILTVQNKIILYSAVNMHDIADELWFFIRPVRPRFIRKPYIGLKLETWHDDGREAGKLYLLKKVLWHVYPRCLKILSRVWVWLSTGFWIIGSTDHLRIVTTSNYNSLTELHTPNITTAHIKSSQSSLAVSL